MDEIASGVRDLDHGFHNAGERRWYSRVILRVGDIGSEGGECEWSGQYVVHSWEIACWKGTVRVDEIVSLHV